VTGESSIQRLEHRFIVETSETIISVGYCVDYLVMCKDGVPISLDPDYLTVIPWNDDINNHNPGYIHFGEHVMFAWCPGTEANVYKFC